MDDRIAEIKGTITLADGSTSEFRIAADGVWSQWGAHRERLGQTVDALTAMTEALTDECLLVTEG